ncbi:NtaA/DmoA family FMN-dependent monooxygenase [Roseovarius sp.]|uniref:NtaA/DmoA family FMN-dependent monooxygenase n=1 Tax=Roseovarius sp. TaxID=1486281 RepID=UPI00263211FC|nr:NtaA/DmoA family FMN-dependent monooxygenase [Roseovarius sp.]MDM8165867.1 NtaA/DmoA family FMN-dependent monooxygenase [Roseovarius sp.]
MSEQMHLIGFYMHSPINHSAMSWADPEDGRLDGMASFDHWKGLARTLERGCFDAAFFADTPGGYDWYRDSLDDYVRYGVCWPSHDPMALMGVMLAETEHLGLALTLSTSGSHPYTTVRRLSTLDYMSGGRVGWNIVSGHLRAEHRALGAEQLQHDERYDHADEYMDVCYALWNGIKPGAILADREKGLYADPEKIDVIDFKGDYFRCRGVPPVLPSAQGRPVLFQAGSSGRGQKFALKHADVVFAIQPQASAMTKFVKMLGETAETEGRKDTPKVTFGIQCVLGGTEEEAKAHQKEMADRIPIDAALNRMSGTMGVDFSRLELDSRLADNTTEASQGMLMALANMAGDGDATVRDAARMFGASTGMPQLVGTPEQVADELETLWRSSGCHGFNITPTTSNRSVEDFVDQVVPLLQKKGIYRTEYTGKTFAENVMA